MIFIVRSYDSLRGMCRFCCRWPWEDPPHTCGFPIETTAAEFALLEEEMLSAERERWLCAPMQGAD